MRKRLGLHSPALAISMIALFVALGGSVYAATKISGKAIKVKSLPGNRVKPHSLPANRLQKGVLSGTHTSGQLTGADINELTLGQVPSAAHAETADTSQSALDAQTALNAVNAVNAETVNGHTVGCMPKTQLFGGACWQTSASEAALTAPAAAADCATQGGELPPPLALAAFATQPGINLDAGDEWSNNVSTVSGADTYAVVVVSTSGVVDKELSTATLKYRCVFSLVR